MKEIILSCALGRESWGDPNVTIYVDNLFSLKQSKLGEYKTFVSFKARVEQTPFELLNSFIKYIADKVKESPSSWVGNLEAYFGHEENPDKQYGLGIQYSPQGICPRRGESEEEIAKKDTEVKKRNASIDKILLPVFMDFVK